MVFEITSITKVLAHNPSLRKISTRASIHSVRRVASLYCFATIYRPITTLGVYNNRELRLQKEKNGDRSIVFDSGTRERTTGDEMRKRKRTRSWRKIGEVWRILGFLSDKNKKK